MKRQSPPPTAFPAELDRFGQRIAQRLNHGSQELPYDISERLRAARMQALAKRKTVPVIRLQAATATATASNSGTLSLGGDFLGWWGRLASAVPLVALVAGLFVIQVIQDENRVNELAEVDAALLTDDLPPEAYSDPGFAQFIKTRAAEDR